MNLSAVEIRVLGCLIEKQRTTPDAYPLSLNALRAACNQATNRDPVVEYDEATIRDALHRLGPRRWTRLTSGQGSRAAKYRHMLDETLGLAPDELAVLAILMLRGAQTPGELRQRSERLHPFPDAPALHSALERLIGRELIARLPRRPGQKEERYAHRLDEGQADDGGPSAREASSAPPAVASPERVASSAPPAVTSPEREASSAPRAVTAAEDADRLDRMERQIAELTAQVAELRAAARLERP